MKYLHIKTFQSFRMKVQRFNILHTIRGTIDLFRLLKELFFFQKSQKGQEPQKDQNPRKSKELVCNIYQNILKF